MEVCGAEMYQQKNSMPGVLKEMWVTWLSQEPKQAENFKLHVGLKHEERIVTDRIC